jgi:glycosyltransferase involved in cell wall biosynthesis
MRTILSWRGNGLTWLPSANSGDYVAFLGRMSPEKRPDRAISIARALVITLKIAAKVDRVDEAYFRAKIAPLLDGPGVELSRGEVRPSNCTNRIPCNG